MLRGTELRREEQNEERVDHSGVERDRSGEKMSRDKGSSQEGKMGLERSRADYREVARSRERQSKRKKSRIQGQERS